jgi:SOS regulatory protein LexA
MLKGGDTMELAVAQKKIIEGKPFGCTIVKGANKTGKTIAAVHRMLYLKNNYCLYEEDGVLVVGSNEQNAEQISKVYTKAEEENSYQYYTLFSNTMDKIVITTIDDIVSKYFSEYCKARKLAYHIIGEVQRKELIEACIAEFRKKGISVKIIDSKYLNFIVEEISWIKACGFKNLDEYQEAERLGRKYTKEEGPQRLLKNSKERKSIYEIVLLYNKSLREKKLIDNEDIVDYALKQANKKGIKRYSHIIIDESHKYTRTQLELMKVLCKDKTYSSMMLVINTEDIVNRISNAWFVKGRKYNTLGLSTAGKTHSLKIKFEEVNDADISKPNIIQDKDTYIEEGVSEMKENNASSSSVEKFEYYDIRHYRKYDFIRDPDNIQEIIVKSESGEEEYASEYLNELPVYSDIAAGEPILMNSEQEANFYIPQYWLRGVKDCFILKVRGDSMKGANINDGDYVIIRKQQNAQNNDIVAVDLEGSATLKRLSLGKGGATLMPENPKYSPIPLYDREATVIGIAVGLIKNKN